MLELWTAGVSVGNDDLRVESATLLFELRPAIEATIAGIKRIMTRPGQHRRKVSLPSCCGLSSNGQKH